MKINEHILSLPPYISTTWQNVSGIYQPKPHLIEIQLDGNRTIEIPLTDEKTIDLIFYFHSKFLEMKTSKSLVNSTTDHPAIQEKKEKEPVSFSFPLPFPLLGDQPLSFTQILQHNPDLSHIPPIPKALLEKVASFASTLGPEMNQTLFPDTQPHCNCLYCQVGKALNQNPNSSEVEPTLEDELVSDEELKFKEWEITKKSDHLYAVQNPLDPIEHYRVFLGSPIGCTCGHNNCEHIKAVLSSEL